MTRFPREGRLVPVQARRFLVGAGIIVIAASAGRAHAEAPRVYAITHAHVVTTPGSTLDDATVVVRDGLIDAVGTGLVPPPDAAILDSTDMTVTAGFIDACSSVGLKQSQPATASAGGGFGRGGSTPRPTPPGPVHPLAKVHPEKRAVDDLVTDETAFEKYRKIGFTSALTLPSEGIFRGEAVLLNLGSGTPADNIVKVSAGQVIAFEHGRFGQGYPTSLMGSIAAVRQTLLDTQRYILWEDRYRQNPVGMRRPEEVAAFGAMADAASGKASTFFDIDASADVARALGIVKEFSLDAILIGSGAENSELGTIDALKKAGVGVILPLAYPEEPEVDDADEALNVSLQDLRRWDAAPANPSQLHDAGIGFAFGTCRLSGVGEFIGNLRKAIDRGLPVDVALGALTTQPAKILGVDRTLGSIESGKIANLVIFAGATPEHGVFAEKARASKIFVDGVKFEIEQKESKGDPDAKEDPLGTWSITFTIGGRPINRTWTLTGKSGAYEGTAETHDGTVNFKSIELKGNEMTVKLPGQGGRPAQELVVIIDGDSMKGDGEFPGGMSYSIKGKRTSGPKGGVL